MGSQPSECGNLCNCTVYTYTLKYHYNKCRFYEARQNQDVTSCDVFTMAPSTMPPSNIQGCARSSKSGSAIPSPIQDRWFDRTCISILIQHLYRKQICARYKTKVSPTPIQSQKMASNLVRPNLYRDTAQPC